MTNTPRYEPVVPPEPPTATDLSSRDEFTTLAAQSWPTMRSNAETWRNGLTAFITLVTTGVVFTGRETATDLPTGWKIVVTLLVGGGLALAVVGLWQALGAHAGTGAEKQDRADFLAEYGSSDAYGVALAEYASSKLMKARRLVAAALALLLLGIIATWWAPVNPRDPPAYLKVIQQGAVTCGRLESADGGHVRVAVSGAHEPALIPLSAITNFSIVAACG